MPTTKKKKALVKHFSEKYNKQFIIMKASLAPSRENRKALMQHVWKCDDFGSMLKETNMHCRAFIPYFINFDFFAYIYGG